MVRRVFEAYTRRSVAILVLDEAIARPRSGHFIQNASKLYFFVYGLVCRSENLRVLLESTRKGVNQLYNEISESASKREDSELSREDSEVSREISELQQ